MKIKLLKYDSAEEIIDDNDIHAIEIGDTKIRLTDKINESQGGIAGALQLRVDGSRIEQRMQIHPLSPNMIFVKAIK